MSIDDLLQYLDFDFAELLPDIPLEYVLAAVVGAVFLFIPFKVVGRRMLLRKLVKKHRKQSKKKYNGERLLEKIDKKRKSGGNTYRSLKRPARKRVKKYLEFKVKQLRFAAMKAKKKGLRIKKRRCYLTILDERKGKDRREKFQNTKDLIRMSNKFDCLDEMILYLDELPERILKDEDFEYRLEENEAWLSYEIR